MVSKVHLEGNLPKQLRKLLRFNLKLHKRPPPLSFTPSPVHLPTELYLLIFTHVARPSFAALKSAWSPNPYSPALILCRVSRAFRRIVLPLLLHTIILSNAKHVLAFLRALQMQRAYAQQENHLRFEYAACVRRIWIGKASMRSWNEDNPRLYRHLHNIDFSLLAPVLLASESLAIDYKNLFLLDSCLKYAWNPRTHLNTAHKSSPLPWNIKTLTLSGNLDSYRPTMCTPEGYAFLASISHIIFFPPRKFNIRLVLPRDVDREKPFHYNIPKYLSNIPWASLTSLQSVSLALPVTTLCHEILYRWLPLLAYHEYSGQDMRVELLAISAPANTLSSTWAQSTPGASVEREEGRISSVDFRATARSSGTTAIHKLIHWELVWACGLC